jgi:hypothetical protein
VPSIICTVIWIAATGRGFFWPAFPMLFLGINLVKTVVRRESVIEREVLRLEEQAAKDAAAELPTGRGDPDEAAPPRTGRRRGSGAGRRLRTGTWAGSKKTASST